MKLFILSLLLLLLYVVNGCVDEPKGICSNVDLGSCGNACCLLSFHFPNLTPLQLVNNLTKMTTNGQHGPDDRYTLTIPAGATKPMFSDLSPYNLTALYIGQVKHTTLSGKYTDTVNIDVQNSNPIGFGCVVKAFSISEIGGAFGDYGQNYCNIVRLMNGLKSQYNLVHLMGCGLGSPGI